MTILETQRTYLREFTGADASDLLRILSDGRAMQFAPIAPTNDLAVAQGFIASHIRNYAQHGFGAWAVILKDGDQFVGQAGLLPQESGVELFYSLVPEYWHQGIATQVAAACRDHAFQKLGLTRLISVIHPDNAGAIGVARKVGMSAKGVIRLWNRADELYEIQRGSENLAPDL